MKGWGFTTVEVAIITTVILAFFCVSLALYKDIEIRTQAVSLMSGLTRTEKSLRAWAADSRLVEWPTNPRDEGTPLADFTRETQGLQRYLKEVPRVRSVHESDWRYKNTGDTQLGCNNRNGGVIIIVHGIAQQAVAERVDRTLDDGNGNCGRVRYSQQTLYYSIDTTSTVTY